MWGEGETHGHWALGGDCPLKFGVRNEGDTDCAPTDCLLCPPGICAALGSSPLLEAQAQLRSLPPMPISVGTRALWAWGRRSQLPCWNRLARSTQGLWTQFL